MPPVVRLFPRAVVSSFANFNPRRQPYMVRRNYLHELRSALTFPLAAALAEGTFTGVVASKYFAAGPLLIAVLTAAPMFGNVLALVWAQLAEGRPMVRFINLLQVATVVCVAAVGLTVFLPLDADTGKPVALAGWSFAALIILARVLASGIITLRSAVWRLNYPKKLRGQIIGRITAVYNAVLSAMVLACAWWLDGQPMAYAIIYPAVALVSLFGVLEFSRVRVRGEARLIRRFHMQPAALSPDGFGDTNGQVPTYDRVARDPHAPDRRGPVAAVRGVVRQAKEGLGLLRSDPLFREYQWWQFVLGASFMMMFPSLIYVVSREMTDPDTQYVLAVVVLQFIPMVTGVFSLQVWAPVFDRTSLFDFRVWLGLVSLASQVLVMVGALTNQLWIVGLGMFVVGVSMGGGNLAWQLGHNTFARPDNVSTYMGVHVMLTGLRGMFAPFLGVAIYHLLSRWLPGAGISNTPGGRWVFLGPVILCVVGTLGYWRMARRNRLRPREEHDDEPAATRLSTAAGLANEPALGPDGPRAAAAVNAQRSPRE